MVIQPPLTFLGPDSIHLLLVSILLVSTIINPYLLHYGDLAIFPQKMNMRLSQGHLAFDRRVL